jgi:hypothetical protein
MFVIVEVTITVFEIVLIYYRTLNWKNGNMCKPLSTAVVRKAEKFSPNVYRAF